MIEKIEDQVKIKFKSWRQYEMYFEGARTGGLKRKLAGNIQRINKILEPIGLELAVKTIEDEQ